LVGVFGVKLLGVAAFLLSLVTGKEKTKNHRGWLLTTTFLLSVLLPSLFIQEGVVWNSIQLMHYAQVPAVLLLLIALPKLVANAKHKVAILVVLLVLALPTTIMTIQQNLTSQQYQQLPPELISNVKNLDLPEGKAVLIDQSLTKYSLISALTGRAVYWADPTMLTLLGLEAAEGRGELQKNTAADLALCPAKSVFIQRNNSQLSIIDCDQLTVD